MLERDVNLPRHGRDVNLSGFGLDANSSRYRSDVSGHNVMTGRTGRYPLDHLKLLCIN